MVQPPSTDTSAASTTMAAFNSSASNPSSL